jgi:hypothetical protein
VGQSGHKARGSGVGVTVGVLVAAGVFVAVAVGVAVSVVVAVGVAVGSGVGVTVGLSVAVEMTVGKNITVAVGVGVSAGVGVKATHSASSGPVCINASPLQWASSPGWRATDVRLRAPDSSSSIAVNSSRIRFIVVPSRALYRYFTITQT